MNNFLALLNKEFLELKRNNKLLIVFVIFIFFAILSPITAKLMPKIFESISTPGLEITIPEPTNKDAIDQFVKNLSTLGFILIFIVAGAIADEKTKKTLEIILTKPIKRRDFILAKFIAYSFIIKLAFLASSVVFYLYTASLFGAVNLGNFVVLCLLLLINILVLTTFTLLGSTIAKSTIGAAIIGFVGMILFNTVVGYIKPISKYSPDFITKHYTELITNGFDAKFLPSAITSIILIIVLTLISIYSFKRQEIER